MRVENLLKGPVFSNENHKSVGRVGLYEEHVSMKYKENVYITDITVQV